jgi:hypothetical protein
VDSTDEFRRSIPGARLARARCNRLFHSRAKARTARREPRLALRTLASPGRARDAPTHCRETAPGGSASHAPTSVAPPPLSAERRRNTQVSLVTSRNPSTFAGHSLPTGGKRMPSRTSLRLLLFRGERINGNVQSQPSRPPAHHRGIPSTDAPDAQSPPRDVAHLIPPISRRAFACRAQPSDTSLNMATHRCESATSLDAPNRIDTWRRPPV